MGKKRFINRLVGHLFKLFNTMRRLLSFLSLFLLVASIKATAANWVVNPAEPVGNGNFHTISAAIAQSSNGDKIMIAAGTYSESNVVLNKSLQLIPLADGTNIVFSSNIEIHGFVGMKLFLLGWQMPQNIITNGGISSGNVVGGNTNQRAEVTFIDCSIGSVILNKDWYKLSAYYSKFNILEYRLGEIIACKAQTITIQDEPGEDELDKENVLIADSVITFNNVNDNAVLRIYNNFLKDLYFVMWNQSLELKNEIRNNDFFQIPVIYFPATGVTRYNFDFSNNLFSENNFYCPAGLFHGECSGCFYASFGSFPVEDCQTCGCCYSYIYFNAVFDAVISGWWIDPMIAGTFDWKHNGFELPYFLSGSEPLQLTNVAGPSSATDGGLPTNEFMDLDLTVNDRGKYGGRYSWHNYFPFNGNNGSKARIVDLSIPVDFIPGNSIQIKSKAIRRN